MEEGGVIELFAWSLHSQWPLKNCNTHTDIPTPRGSQWRHGTTWICTLSHTHTHTHLNFSEGRDIPFLSLSLSLSDRFCTMKGVKRGNIPWLAIKFAKGFSQHLRGIPLSGKNAQTLQNFHSDVANFGILRIFSTILHVLYYNTWF